MRWHSYQSLVVRARRKRNAAWRHWGVDSVDYDYEHEQEQD